MLISDLILEGRDAPLYHGIREWNHALQALNNNEIAATSSQRFWKNGQRLKDDHPDYENSFWMKGVSMTRSKRFAFGWASIVFVIDQTILSKNYKIIPFNWGYSIPTENNHKREQEEFVVIKKTFDTYYNNENFDYDRFVNPEGSIKNLSSMLKDIYLDSHYKNVSWASTFANHPKFSGWFDRTKILLLPSLK